MTRRHHLAGSGTGRTFLALLLSWTLASCGSGGGLGADGGVSGTGLSSVTGNVTEVTGANGDVGGIRVLVQGTDIETVTDDDGSFTLTGDFDGPVIVVFEVEDGGRAETPVDVPTGGNVDLEDITVDPDEGEARPSRRTITFAGLVDNIDCTAALLRVVVGGDGQPTPFTIRLEDAFIHDAAGATIECAEIRPRDEAMVQGEVLEDDRIGNADIEIRRQEPTVTPSPTVQSEATPAATDPGPERTLNVPRATATPQVSDRPIPADTRPDADRPRPTPTATATATDAPRPAPAETPRVEPQPAPPRLVSPPDTR